MQERCELLSFFSIFGIQNNKTRVLVYLRLVVNCFHFSVSLGYKTTPQTKRRTLKKLWIAFIFQYLWDTKQLCADKLVEEIRCELLSFFSIFGIQNNEALFPMVLSMVVNCFHFSVSLGYKTTFWHKSESIPMLWIAFIFQYLWDTKQLCPFTGVTLVRCELLSFFSIFGIQNNHATAKPSQSLVVNCFHFSVSLGYKTTK